MDDAKSKYLLVLPIQSHICFQTHNLLCHFELPETEKEKRKKIAKQRKKTIALCKSIKFPKNKEQSQEK